MRVALVLFGLALAPLCERAQTTAAAKAPASSPVGKWETFDDASGKMKSIVAIREKNGSLDGTIVTLFNPPVPQPTCYLCRGAKKDLPLVGLQVLWGFHADGDEWSGGQVLDPETGKIYRASLALEDGGRRLRLHGYIGIPLLGRTQYWVKAE
ncbi:MAG: DUF2147 domain-containing protein [Terracidiphilus sp.]